MQYSEKSNMQMYMYVDDRNNRNRDTTWLSSQSLGLDSANPDRSCLDLHRESAQPTRFAYEAQESLQRTMF